MTNEHPFDALVTLRAGRTPDHLAGDDRFWGAVRALWDIDPSFVQLNYGYYHPACREVLEAEIAMTRTVNRGGSRFKAHQAEPLRERVRGRLAEALGVPGSTVALVRSSSEALNMVIRGLRLGPGDEVVASTLDYVAAEQVLHQRESDDRVQVRWVALPRDSSAESVVAAYAQAIGPRTRLVLVTHVVHSTGWVLPVAALVNLCRERNVRVLVDSAHGFGHLPCDLPGWGADYVCSSLHKWTGAPLENAFLQVRGDRIRDLSPLYGDVSHSRDDVRKLERLGNRNEARLAGLDRALDLLAVLDVPVRTARLVHLRSLWEGALGTLPGVTIDRLAGSPTSGALGTFTVEGVEPQRLADTLDREFGIFVSVMNRPWGQAVRVVPGLPTSAGEVRALAEAVKAIVS
jgi:selenocysteine lyase/cysteine desulfurase